MSSRLPSILAWSVWALCLALAVPFVWLQTLNAPGHIADQVAGAVMLLVVASVGALIAARQPRNPIGWLFCASVLMLLFGNMALEYSVYGLVTAHVALPGAAGVAVVGGALRGLGWYLLPTFLLLLFPDGRLPSWRWRPAAWLAVAVLIFNTVITFFGQDMTDTDQRLASVRNLRNPFAVFGADLTNALWGPYFLLLLALIALCAAAVIVRFRRSRGQERQQLKWFTYAAALCLLVVLGVVVSAFTNLNPPPVVFYLAIVGLPIGAGIAILRHRLYDIDILINRTLVYGSLTAVLAAVYFGTVIGIQQLTRAFFGTDASNQPVIIALSTLLIAALFTPLRRRLQATIDRRFYRRKYDAAKTLERFAATLRGELDLAELNEHLVGVVDETMQPAQVSLWLRPVERHPADLTLRVEVPSQMPSQVPIAPRPD